MAMLSHRLRRVLVAVPSYFQRSFSLSRASDFTSVSSLLPRSVVKQSTEFGRSPARLFSKTQYQYDPYTGEDSFTPDNEGCDFNHWLITMNFPKDNLPSREEMIAIFEQTCAKGLGISLEEAKKKIYAICTTSYQGFQAKMSVGEVEKFRDLAGVQYIIPDSYVDVENKVYGGDKYENGVITPGPIPVPTREGFDSVEKESMPVQELARISQTLPDQGPTSEKEQAQMSQTPAGQDPTSAQVQDQRSQMIPERRSFKQSQGTLALGKGQGQRSRMSIPGQGQGQGQGNRMPIPRQGQSRGQGSQIPSFQGSFTQSQGTPSVGQGQSQRSQMPSFQKSFKQGQETPTLGQGQAQGSQMPSFQGYYNQSQGIPIHGQGQGQGSQIPFYQVGFNRGQEIQTSPHQVLPSNYSQGAFVYYNQGPPQGNFIQGSQENYNQMGQGNYTSQSGGNYGPAQGEGSPRFGHGHPRYEQGQGGQLLSPSQRGYNQGEGTMLPGQGQGSQIPSYQKGYSQGLGAPVPPCQGSPGNYGQWAFVNNNQGPPHGNFLQGPQQNYNQGGQWNYSPLNGGHYGPAQFGQRYPGPHQGQGNQMPQYQLSYIHGQGTPFPGQCQCQCQGCGMPSYQGSYNQGQGTQIPGQWQGQRCAMPSYQVSYNQGQAAPTSPYHGNYNQGMSSSYNHGQGTQIPGKWQGQGCATPSYQVSYNHGQGTQIPGQWQGQGCATPSYQVSYNQGQAAPTSPYHGNYNQGTPGSYGQGTSTNFNQGFPVNQANYNMQNGGNYGPAHGSAGNPGFGQGFPGHGQNQTPPQEGQRNVAGDRSNNDPADPTETRILNSQK